jgi:hypothetical protein
VSSKADQSNDVACQLDNNESYVKEKISQLQFTDRAFHVFTIPMYLLGVWKTWSGNIGGACVSCVSSVLRVECIIDATRWFGCGAVRSKVGRSIPEVE